MATIHETMLTDLFENLVTTFIQKNLEQIMKAEIQSYMNSDEASQHNSRNGYYKRTLHTKFSGSARP